MASKLSDCTALNLIVGGDVTRFTALTAATKASVPLTLQHFTDPTDTGRGAAMDIKEAIKQLIMIRDYRAYWLKYTDFKGFVEKDIAALNLAIRALESLSGSDTND